MSIQTLAYEKIDNTYSRAKFADFEVVMRMEDGYINASHMCRLYNKKFNDWTRGKDGKAIIRAYNKSTGISVDNLLVHIKNGPNDIRGTYVYPDLAFTIAQWCNPEYSVMVNEIIRKHHIQEKEYQLFLAGEKIKQQSKTIKKKDDKIDKLQQKLDEMERKMAENHRQVMDGHEKIHKDNRHQTRLLQDAHVKLDHSHKKMKMMRKNCVVRSEKRKPGTLVIMKLFDEPSEKLYNFYAIKCNKSSVKSRIKSFSTNCPEAIPVHQVDDIPNAIEFWQYICKKYNIEKDNSYFDLADMNYCEFIDVLNAEYRRQMEDDIQ